MMLYHDNIFTICSEASNFRYLWINFCIQLIVLNGSTVQLRFLIIGTLPVAFSNIQTIDYFPKRDKAQNQYVSFKSTDCTIR